MIRALIDAVWWAVFVSLNVAFFGIMGWAVITGNYFTGFLLVLVVMCVAQLIKPGRWFW
jgi:predicted small integral membrane protein